ncbi:MAG: 23S rRNA (uracil(1939)-C(5))-methyltransferase RlmD, partial [Candidatus Izemoplasmataceae bacterium]
METNLEKNQEVLITIKKIGINGEGIGYYKRQAVFVDGAIPPEEVVVKISSLHKGYAIGDIVRIKKKAFYRTRPFCKHYDVCGGCQLQHVQYEEQLRLKEDLLKQAFMRYTSVDLDKVKFYPFSPFVKSRNYRFKAQMPVRNTSDGLVTGLYKKGSNDLVDVLSCPVQDPRINEVNQRTLELCDEYEIFAFDPKEMRGLLRYIVTRVSSLNGDIQVTLVVTIYNHALKDVAKKLIEHPLVKSVAISKNHDAKNHEIFGDTFEILAGEETITEGIGDIRFALNPKAFFQLNPEEATKMYNYVKTLFNPKHDKTLLDLYTGSGAMALYYAKLFDKVYGIDSNPASIESANQNKKLNKISNVEFLKGDAYETVQHLYKQGKSFDVVVFDPPRVGLDDKMLDLLIRKPIKKLIYVSCNPSTLAKNIKQLSRKYKVESIMPFDMFPQTAH